MSASPALAHGHSGLPFLSHIQTNGHSSSAASSNNMLSMDAPPTTVPQQNGMSHVPEISRNGHSENGLATYTLPDHRLKRKLRDSSKTPLLLVACGSFSPITNLHLRMFEMVADHVKFSTNYEIVGGYLSPVSDDYKKAGLASAHHR